MSTGLVLTALLMGLAGSPHCAAMCGAAVGGIGRTPQKLWAFQGGRMLGYALLGAAVAASAGLLQWASAHSALLKPFWAMLQLAILALGLSLLWLGRQPHWLDRWAHQVWRGIHGKGARLQGGLVMLGFAASSAVGLHLGPTLWRRWRRATTPRDGRWGVRLAGFAVACAAGWALGHGLWMEYGALFCA